MILQWQKGRFKIYKLYTPEWFGWYELRIAGIPHGIFSPHGLESAIHHATCLWTKFRDNVPRIGY